MAQVSRVVSNAGFDGDFTLSLEQSKVILKWTSSPNMLHFGTRNFFKKIHMAKIGPQEVVTKKENECELNVPQNGVSCVDWLFRSIRIRKYIFYMEIKHARYSCLHLFAIYFVTSNFTSPKTFTALKKRRDVKLLTCNFLANFSSY